MVRRMDWSGRPVLTNGNARPKIKRFKLHNSAPWSLIRACCVTQRKRFSNFVEICHEGDGTLVE